MQRLSAKIATTLWNNFGDGYSVLTRYPRLFSDTLTLPILQSLLSLSVKGSSLWQEGD